MFLTLVRWMGAHRILLAIIGAGALLGVLAWSVWAIRNDGYEVGRAEVQARWDEAVRMAEQRARAEERLVQRAVDAIGVRLSADLSRLRIEHRTINRRIVDEVRSVPVYSECHLSDGVWRQLNQLRAATDSGVTGGGGAAVSGAGADP